MKSLFFGKFAALAAAVSLAAAVGARAQTQTFGATNFSDLMYAVESYPNSAADVVIIVTGSVSVSSTVSINRNARGKTLTIRGGSTGGVLARGAGLGGPMFVLFGPPGGVSMVLDSVVIDGMGLSAAGPLVSVMSGCSLTVKNGAILRNNAAGGGVAVSDGGKFVMTGGNIVNNAAPGANGGGVSVSGGSFDMRGGEISGNTAGAGGGVYIGPSADAFKIGGGAKIIGNKNSAGAASNVYLASGQYIALQTPSDTMDIGVSTATAGGVVVLSGADDSDILRFFADQNDRRVTRSGSQLVISNDDRPSLAAAAVTVTQTGTLKYTGVPQTPAQTPVFNVTYNDTVLVPGKNRDYTVEAAPQIGAGQYNTAVIKSARNGKCKGEITGVTWVISKATPNIVSWPDSVTITYGTSLSDTLLKGGNADSVSGKFEWVNSATVPAVASHGSSFGVIFRPYDNFNYNNAAGSVKVNVTPKQGEFKSHPNVTVAYKPGLKLDDIPLDAGYEWNDGDTRVDTTRQYSAEATYTDPSGNYTRADGRILVTVNRAVIDIRAILGVIPPAPGAKPVTAIESTEQYTGTVTWSANPPSADPSLFQYNTVYTARVNLISKDNYIFNGVPENFFVVAGAYEIKNTAGSGVVTAVFPATGPKTAITIAGPQALTVVRRGSVDTLSVSASASPSAVLSYQWYECGNVSGTVKTPITGATGANYAIPGTLARGTHFYKCEVTAATGGLKETSSSTVATVEVRDVPTLADLNHTNTKPVIPYDGLQHAVTVTAVPGKAGSFGGITVRYNGSVTAPVNAGTYEVTADIAAGTGYDAETILIGSFTISRAQVTIDNANSVIAPKQYDGTSAADVSYVAFSGVVAGQTFVKGTDYTVSDAAFDGVDAGVRTVAAIIELLPNAKTANYALAGANLIKSGVTISRRTLRAEDFSAIPTGRRENGTPQPIVLSVKPELSGLGIGTVTVFYDGAPASDSYPVAAKSYAVTVNVAGGANFNAVAGLSLGTYTIRSNIVESILDAKVEFLEEFVYSGSPQIPAARNISVTFDGMTLEYGVDYTVTASDNVNAGTALAAIAGRGYFIDTVFAEFTIAKKTPELSDLAYSLRAVAYNADVQPVVVAPVSRVTGLGDITVSYGSAAAVPLNAGTYEVFVDIADGVNYTARQSLRLGTYTIQKKSPKYEDLIFSIPTDHYYTGKPQGIGAIRLKGTGYGTVTLLYDNAAALPIEAGTYELYLAVSGGENYSGAAGVLGEYTIAEERISVLTPDRAIPAGVIEDAVTAPVNQLTTELIAGPNPVAKSLGAVKFFRRGKWAIDGELIIYDASGNFVNRVNIRDRITASGNNDRRETGSWDLKDASGKLVANGTYLAKGTITTADGKKERVAVIIGVR